jgi:glutamyl-tRNA synthetase
MNYCYARRNGGQFILRIEDTDQTRSTQASERMIVESLRWLGLDWDEGPDIGGPCGPYRQSERVSVYTPFVDTLLKEGHAFRCYCPPERLAAMRAEQTRLKQRPAYDGHCLSLSREQSDGMAADGIPHVVRMKVPESGACTVWDMRRGPVTIDWENVDMQVLVKSDGMPTYHLANVVDDHLMGITHVLRGEEWLASAPKHLLLYQYLGWDAPRLCHLPLLRNPDRSKLSKRRNPTGLTYYRRAGILPEALVNMLGLFALSIDDGDELLSLDQIVNGFVIDNIALGGPVFDAQKLSWLNGRHIRETLSPKQFANQVAQWALRPDFVSSALELARTRIEKLSDLPGLLGFLLTDGAPGGQAELFQLKLDDQTKRMALQMTLWRLDDLDEWTSGTIESAMRSVCDSLDMRFRDFVKIFYLAITGTSRSVPVIQSMALLGRDITRERLRRALDFLGGSSPEEIAAWRGGTIRA